MTTTEALISDIINLYKEQWEINQELIKKQIEIQELVNKLNNIFK